MEALDLEPRISPNRRGVIFVLAWKAGAVECTTSRAVRESYFWLPPQVDDATMLKFFTMESTGSTPSPIESFWRTQRRALR